MVGAVWPPGKPRTISSSDRARGAGLDRRLASDGSTPIKAAHVMQLRAAVVALE